MPSSVKDLIRGGVKAGTFAAGIGAKTGGALFEQIKSRTPFGADADDQRFSATAVPPPASAVAQDPAPAPIPEARVKTSSKTEAPTPKPVAQRISNPKAAKAARKRAKATHLQSVDASGATGRGGRPATIAAENVPTDLAARKAGRGAAPMGSSGPTT